MCVCVCKCTHRHMLAKCQNSRGGLPGSPGEQTRDVLSGLGSVQVIWSVSQHRWWSNNLLRDMEMSNVFGYTLVSFKTPEHRIFIG